MASRERARPNKHGLVGSAGEHFVLYKLQLLGLLSAPAPRGYKAVDIVVLNPDQSVVATLQVKTRTYGRDGGWHMGAKHEGVVLPRLFYCFVDFEPTAPVTYIVPSEVVAEVVAKAYRSWLAVPGKRGQPHRETDFRRIQPAYDFPVAGYEPGWMDRYRENWALLHGTSVA